MYYASKMMLIIKICGVRVNKSFGYSLHIHVMKINKYESNRPFSIFKVTRQYLGLFFSCIVVPHATYL